MRIFRGDFETRSEAELAGKNSVGLYNYATHPTTKSLLFAYELPSFPEPKLWQCFEPWPEELREAFREVADPTSDLYFSAFNSAFERYILWAKHDIIVPTNKIIDPQACGRYASIPADLEGAGDALGLPAQLMKDKRGEELIDLFSLPHTRKKKEGGGTYFNDWSTHPSQWEWFGEYCKKDVIAEKEISRRLQILDCLPLPELERKIWVLDQTINDRGMPVDRKFVESALKLALRAKEEALDRQNKLTGLDNANSQTQLLPWVKARGYKFNTLRKETVDGVLKDPETKITPECREVLMARREAASTSYTKLAAILRQVNIHGRLCNQFIFMGSSRCGRWAGNSVQLHNMARPDGTFEKRKNLDDARALIYAEDYEGIKERFKDPKTGKPGSVLLVIKNCIRTVFVAPKEVG